jgi:hypothetical protein
MLVKSLILFFIILFFIILIGCQIYSSHSTIIEGLCPDESLKDHDEIIRIQSELNNKFRPLITDSAGQPVNLLSRVAKLESNVQIITDQMVQSSKAQVEAVPPNPQVEPLPEGN